MSRSNHSHLINQSSSKDMFWQWGLLALAMLASIANLECEWTVLIKFVNAMDFKMPTDSKSLSQLFCSFCKTMSPIFPVEIFWLYDFLKAKIKGICFWKSSELELWLSKPPHCHLQYCHRPNMNICTNYSASVSKEDNIFLFLCRVKH